MLCHDYYKHNPNFVNNVSIVHINFKHLDKSNIIDKYVYLK